MIVRINDIPFDVPFCPVLIELHRWVDYYEMYGKRLALELSEIEEFQYYGDDVEEQKKFALERHIDNKAMAWYGYWAGVDLLQVNDKLMIAPLLEQYRTLSQLLDDKDDFIIPFVDEVLWNGETWMIQDFKAGSFADMSFNEMRILNSLVIPLLQIEKNNWEALLYLCLIFFRKKGEPVWSLLEKSAEGYFTPTIIPNAERVNMLMHLPMNYALSVYELLKDTLPKN